MEKPFLGNCSFDLVWRLGLFLPTQPFRHSLLCQTCTGWRSGGPPIFSGSLPFYLSQALPPKNLLGV